jgi:hypothetical protein
MKRVIAVAIIAMMIDAPVSSGALPAGKPSTDARRAWCEARFATCVKMTKRPGFLGGALNYCGGTAKPACADICERRWGKSSDCLTRLRPEGGEAAN